jgi:hypothetical protein
MNLLRISIVLTVLFSFYSCEKSTENNDSEALATVLKGEGTFIINEGNYLSGNGSLSFYSYSNGKIYNDIFSSVNSRPLGDVPNSLTTNGNNAYIVINNSGNIEVVEKNSLKSLKTISGLNSPRNILIVGNEKAYVSSLYSNNLTIINLLTNSVSGSISLRRTSESMVMVGNRAFISSWSQGKEIMVVNTVTDKTVDSILVAPEPESMVVDKNQKVWVLCSGGYTGQVHAELDQINPYTDVIERQFVFPSKLSYPSCLQLNKTKDTLYFVDSGIWRMSITANILPSAPFIKPAGRFVYKLGVDPRYNRIFYTDAIDYKQKGYVIQINSKGMQVDSSRADIIPGSFCFK